MLTATPSSVAPGQSSTLHWSVSGPSACLNGITLDGQSVGTNGSRTLTPLVTESHVLRRGSRSLASRDVNVVPPDIPPAPHAFLFPKNWTTEFNYGGHHKMADVDGNAMADIVEFGTDGVRVALSKGNGFDKATLAVENFGTKQGWRDDRHVRELADVNGDGKADIVGFGQAAVYLSLALGDGRFQAPQRVVDDLVYESGWRVDQHVRLLGDVNCDGRADIVAFGRDGVWTAFSTGNGFTAPVLAITDLGYAQSWRVPTHPRLLGDVNGDRCQDIVAFGQYGVTLALSNGSGFAAPQLVLSNFGSDPKAGSWKADKHLRLLSDFNGDGRDDIVAFGDQGVWTSLSSGTGFSTPQFALADFGSEKGWLVGQHPRYVTDVNGDHRGDLIAFATDGVHRLLTKGNGFAEDWVLPEFSYKYGSWQPRHTRVLADTTGDGLPEIVGFGDDAVYVAESVPENLPPPLPLPPGVSISLDKSTSDSLAVRIIASQRADYLTTWLVGRSGTEETSSKTEVERKFEGLSADTRYCVRAKAGNAGGSTEKEACYSTGSEISSGTTLVLMKPEGLGNTGNHPHTGLWGPIIDARPVRLWMPAIFGGDLFVHFLRAGHITAECFGPNHANATVTLVDGGSLGPEDIAKIFGAPPPPGLQLKFAACITPVNVNTDGGFFFNLDWST